MEKINYLEKIEIGSNFQNTEEKISSEEKNKQQNKKLENTKSFSELNCSISTNYSNNNLSTDNSINNLNNSNIKLEDTNTAFKIDKVNKITKQNKKCDYLFNFEYLDEIYINLILDEKTLKLKIDQNYMKRQNYINNQMRAILVDWLIEVHNHLHLKRKTLFQAILILDLYLSLKVIQKVYFQLLGVASLLISFKENENYNLDLETFIKITDNAYTTSELIKMEKDVLLTLHFEILYPTSEEFYNILSKVFNFNKTQHHLGEYFIDSSLVDYNMLKYKPSTIAIACAYIVMKFYKLKGYKILYLSKNICGDSTEKIIKECTKKLCCLVKYLSKSSLKGAKEKYSSEEYDKISSLCED